MTILYSLQLLQIMTWSAINPFYVCYQGVLDGKLDLSFRLKITNCNIKLPQAILLYIIVSSCIFEF